MGGDLFLVDQVGVYLFFLFFSRRVVSCLFQPAESLWPLNLFLSSFFYLRFYHSGCVFLSNSFFKDYTAYIWTYTTHIYRYIYIYIEIFTCLTFDFPPFFLFSFSLPLFKCAFCVSFMNMTDMCKYGMNLRGTGVVLGWGGGIIIVIITIVYKKRKKTQKCCVLRSSIKVLSDWFGKRRLPPGSNFLFFWYILRRKKRKKRKKR